MEKLERLKALVAERRKELEELTARAESHARKQDEVRGRLSELGRQLVETRAGLDAAVARFARGEVAEGVLDDAQARVSSLEAKEKTISAVLKVVENDLGASREKTKTAAEELNKVERAAWHEISKIELAKAGAILRRAFAAHIKTGSAGLAGLESREIVFLKDSVYDATFCSGRESEGLLVDQMMSEYLSEGRC